MWRDLRFPFFLWVMFTFLTVGVLAEEYWQGKPEIGIVYLPPACESIVVRYRTPSGYLYRRREVLCPGPEGKVYLKKTPPPPGWGEIPNAWACVRFHDGLYWNAVCESVLLGE